MKILVTGGAGNIGSALVERILLEKNIQIVVVDNLSTGNYEKIPLGSNNIKFIKADVNKLEEIAPIMAANKFDYVFHYAAFVGVQRTQENPIKVMEDIDGIKNMLSLSKNTGVKRFFFSSSSEVYGEPVTIPQHEETTPLNSRVPYAVVKNVGEAFCRSYNQEYGLEYTIFRFFNTYGPNQTRDFVISKFMYQALNNQPITIFGDGSQTRTFCYVKDNVDATIMAWKNNLYINDVINIGGAHVVSILELARLIIKLTKSNSTIEFLPPLQDGDMTRRQPDNSKMKKILERDLISIKEGIQLLLKDSTFMSSMRPS